MAAQSGTTSRLQFGICIRRTSPRHINLLRGWLQYRRDHPNVQWRLYSNAEECRPDYLRHQNLDGLICTREAQPAGPDMAETLDCPVVLVDAGREDPRYSSLCVDDEFVGRMAAEFYQDRGFPALGYYGFEDDAAWRRLAGVRSAAEQAGIAFHGNVLRRDPSRMPTFSQAVGEPAMERWLTQLPLPIGLLVFNDEIGRRLVRVCEILGKLVPEQIAILGVDNLDEFCEFSNPPLSSIDLDHERIGYQAAELLSRRVRHENAPPEHLLSRPSRIVRRGSTRCYHFQDDLVSRLMGFIEAHAQDNIQVEDLVRETDVSRSTLERLFREQTGRSPAEEIRRMRMERTRELLLHTDRPLIEIARDCGFSHLSLFSRTFKQVQGVTPSEFRRSGQARLRDR
jgi:LacI family transcriptional regulator